MRVRAKPRAFTSGSTQNPQLMCLSQESQPYPWMVPALSAGSLQLPDMTFVIRNC
ncbi:hypothetical protein FHR51_002072 [Xanthomonas arboricola]|nr:hypothetical protein [Xanthomonas cannabis]